MHQDVINSDSLYVQELSRMNQMGCSMDWWSASSPCDGLWWFVADVTDRPWWVKASRAAVLWPQAAPRMRKIQFPCPTHIFSGK